MVEVENNRIRLPAIDAGVVREIRHQSNEVALAMGSLEGSQVDWIGDGHIPFLRRTPDDSVSVSRSIPKLYNLGIYLRE